LTGESREKFRKDMSKAMYEMLSDDDELVQFLEQCHEDYAVSDKASRFISDLHLQRFKV
jgi:hypothetical protein